MAGTITVSGSSANAGVQARTFGPDTITGAVIIDETLDVAVASGDNTIAIPVGAVAAIIQPPEANTVALKLRTSLNSTDGGIPLAPAEPSVYAFPATAPTTLILNAASAVTGSVVVFFI